MKTSEELNALFEHYTMVTGQSAYDLFNSDKYINIFYNHISKNYPEYLFKNDNRTDIKNIHDLLDRIRLYNYKNNLCIYHGEITNLEAKVFNEAIVKEGLQDEIVTILGEELNRSLKEVHPELFLDPANNKLLIY